MQRSHSVERDHGDRFDAMVVDTSSEEGKRRAKEANEYWEREIRIEGMKDDFRNLILESEMFQQGRDQGEIPTKFFWKMIEEKAIGMFQSY